jgi:hypothetical protein
MSTPARPPSFQPAAGDPRGPADSGRARGSSLRGGLLMILLGLLLSWLPILGPAIAGFVGGRVVGDPGGAVLAGLLPALALGALILAVLWLFDLAILGAVAGVAAVLIVAVSQLPLLVGAWFGGAQRV